MATVMALAALGAACGGDDTGNAAPGGDDGGSPVAVSDSGGDSSDSGSDATRATDATVGDGQSDATDDVTNDQEAGDVDAGEDAGSGTVDSGTDSGGTPTPYDGGLASRYVSGGRINIEVNLTATVDSVSYGTTTYVWSVAPGLDLYINTSNDMVVFDANGIAYSCLQCAVGWRAGALVDLWFAAGGGIVQQMQYRSTYSPNTNGYFESGLPISVNPFGAAAAGAIDAGASMITIGSALGGGGGGIGNIRGVNLNMPDGASQPTWAATYPLTSGSATRNWIVIGDSLETGYNSGVSGFPSYTIINLGTGWELNNQAVAGQQTSTMLANVGAQVYANMVGGIRNVVTFEGAINDLLNGRSEAQIWTTYQQFALLVKAYAAGSYSAWTTLTSYPPGAMVSNGVTLFQTISGGISGAFAPTGTTVDATVSDGDGASAGVTWFVTGPVSQNTGSPFRDLVLGVQTPPITWGADTALQPALATLSDSILGSVPTTYDFVMQNLQQSDVMNNDAQVPWRINDLVHPSASSIVRQGSLSTHFLRGY